MQFKFIFVAVLVFVSQAIFSQEISEKSLRKHVTYLASDKLKGRATGTPQELKAAQYIAKQFKKIGLKPEGRQRHFFSQIRFQEIFRSPWRY